ncbi:MAG: multicopper oxidase domain-containing protein [Rhodocyclaceae bacterium]|nr:multicopper oxidase domain-containing protein [Rhodocyclaceae bacterium]
MARGRRSTSCANAMRRARSTSKSSSRSGAISRRSRAMANPINRRGFLTAAAATVAAGAVPSVLWTPHLAMAQPTEAFRPDVEIELDARPDEIAVLPGRPTEVWRYAGRVISGPSDTVQPIAASFAGPILKLRTGQKVRIRFRNRLTQPSIVHWHGLVVPEQMDGHPRYAIAPGDEYLYEFEVRNRAGTYWFHPHPHGRTGGQVNAGLAGFILVTDEEERSLGLPDGERDIAIVLADRTFDRDNQLVYDAALGRGMMVAMTGFVGERILANGRPSLALAVASEAHRIRLLNGANSRIYRIARSDGKPLVVIGTDGGLLATPEVRPFVVIGPAERTEFLLDLYGESSGSRIALLAEPVDFGGMGMMGGMMGRGMMGGGGGPRASAPYPFAVFSVARRGQPTTLPARLSELPPVAAPRESRVREFAITVGHMQWGINGRTFAMDEVAPDERVRFGDTEVWAFVNRTRMMALPHPMHIHGLQFRVLARSGTPPGLAGLRAGVIDSGLKDTVLVFPGEEVQVLARFDAFRGTFLYHCHNLEHEDMGMMRNYSVS